MTARELATFALGLVLGAAGVFSVVRVRDGRAPLAQPRAHRDDADDDPPEATSVASARPTSKAELQKALGDLARRKADLQRREADLARRQAALEAELAATQAASANGSDAAPARSRYDLTKQDWAELAERGAVRYCLPSGARWKSHPEQLEELGLGPQDADTLDQAYARSTARLVQAFAPLCPELADGGVPRNVVPIALCAESVLTDAQRGDASVFDKARRDAGEIRAGMRPEPAANEATTPVLRVLLSLTGETDELVRDLSVQYGPDAARKIVYRERGCVLGGSIGD